MNAASTPGPANSACLFPPHTNPTPQRGRWFLRRSLLLTPFLIVWGCGAGAPEPIRLTLVSPHRDEIREEVAWAFHGWFKNKTAVQLRDAEEALDHKPVDKL